MGNDLVKELFGGIGEAPDTRDGNYCKAGKYWSRIERIKVDKNRSGDPFFAIELKTVKVIENKYIELDEEDKEIERTGHREGEKCSYFVPNYGRGKDMFLSNCKTSINGICAFQGISLDGMPDDEVLEFIGGIVSDDQPLAGLVVEWHATQREKGDSKPGKRTYFTRVIFDRTVPDAELEKEGIAIENSTLDEDAASAELED